MQPRINLGRIFTVAPAIVASCAATVPLSELAATPNLYEGKRVHTCGWATNHFEDMKITVLADDKSNSDVPGLGVDWAEPVGQQLTEIDGELVSTPPKQRCITGSIRRLCEPKAVQSEGQRIICVSTAHPYQWVIDQD